MHYSKSYCNSHFMPSSDGGSSLCLWQDKGKGGGCWEDAVNSMCYTSPWDVQAVCPQILETRNKILTSDLDQDGRISESEMGHFMRAQGMSPTDTELEGMLMYMGGDISTGISFDDFLFMMVSEMAKTPVADKATDENLFWSTFPCEEYQEVSCPISGDTCTGDVCCQGVKESGGLAFPCPSASSSWCECSNRTKLQDCTTTIVAPKGASMCAGTCDLASCTAAADEFGGWKAWCEFDKMDGAWATCQSCDGCCAVASM